MGVINQRSMQEHINAFNQQMNQAIANQLGAAGQLGGYGAQQQYPCPYPGPVYSANPITNDRPYVSAKEKSDVVPVKDGARKHLQSRVNEWLKDVELPLH